jgi:hypothetical protein
MGGKRDNSIDNSILESVRAIQIPSIPGHRLRISRHGYEIPRREQNTFVTVPISKEPILKASDAPGCGTCALTPPLADATEVFAGFSRNGGPRQTSWAGMSLAFLWFISDSAVRFTACQAGRRSPDKRHPSLAASPVFATRSPGYSGIQDSPAPHRIPLPFQPTRAFLVMTANRAEQREKRS